MHEVHARVGIFWNQIRGSDSVLARVGRGRRFWRHGGLSDRCAAPSNWRSPGDTGHGPGAGSTAGATDTVCLAVWGCARAGLAVRLSEWPSSRGTRAARAAHSGIGQGACGGAAQTPDRADMHQSPLFCCIQRRQTPYWLWGRHPPPGRG